jgi:hypothetical protein
MSILRLVERVMGEGDLLRDGARVLRVGYELAVYDQLTAHEGRLIPGGGLVEGHLHAAPDALEPLLGTASPLTLLLDDGRRCDLYLLNSDGVITSANERGFYGL